MLIAGATAAAACYVLGGRPPPNPAYLVFYLGTPAVGVAFMVAGLAAWHRWPSSRLGVLFSLVGYFYLLPALDYLDDSVGFTIGNAAISLAGAALAHLGLAWPTGRPRSRFERGVVVAEYARGRVQRGRNDVLGSGVQRLQRQLPGQRSARGDGSMSAWNAVNTISGVGVALTVIVLTLIVQHWRLARGWSRRAMVPVVWIGFAIGLEQTLIWGPFDLPVSDLVLRLAQLVLMAGPLLFVISTARAWTARGALGAAIMDLEPGAPSGQLRDALARALGDSTLQVAFHQPDGSGYVDTAGQAVEVAQPDPGRAVVGSHEATGAVLVYDAGLELEPQLVRLTAAAASMALEHARLQAEVQAQLEQVRASRSRIVEAGDAERRRLERDLHDGAQQRLVTLIWPWRWPATGRRGQIPAAATLIESAGKEAREALTELRELARGIHPAVLTETGLAGAIQALAERSPADTIIAVPGGRFPAAIEATAYFVVCEALANVAKHAMAGTPRWRSASFPDASWYRSATTGPGVPGPNRDPACAAWPTGWRRRAACCGWTARRGAGPSWKQTSHVRDGC